MLQGGVGQLHRVEFRGVARQEEALDVLLVFKQPRLHELAVMDAQVVQHQEDLVRRVLDQSLEELDQHLGVQCPMEDHPAHFPLVAYHGDHRAAMPPLVAPDGRGDPLGGESASAHIIAAQAGFVTLLDRGPLRLCTVLDRRELLFKPSAYCVRVLLVCPLQRLLRREAPAL
jgi:hypothetical protein